MTEAPTATRYEPISVGDQSTVVAEFLPDDSRETAYQSEAELEATFIDLLRDQAYEYLRVPSESALVANLRLQLEALNAIEFSDEEWQHLKPMILGAIMEHFMSGSPAVAETANDEETGSYDPKDEAVVTTIKELLETRVRPAVAQDGGDITFSGFRDGVVYLRMRGACSGCPSSTATLRHGIENLLRHFCPEVQQVQAAGLVAHATDRDRLGAEPDLQRRVHPRLLDVAADDGEVAPAEHPVQVQEGRAILEAAVALEADDLELLGELMLLVRLRLGVPVGQPHPLHRAGRRPRRPLGRHRQDRVRPAPAGRLMDPATILFGFGVGLLVGITGMGGGSLMTPLLILVLGVKPVVAVGTEQRVKLIERLAGLISEALLREFPAREVTVRVRKLTSPLDGIAAVPGVKMKRTR